MSQEMIHHDKAELEHLLPLRCFPQSLAVFAFQMDAQQSEEEEQGSGTQPPISGVRWFHCNFILCVYRVWNTCRAVIFCHFMFFEHVCECICVRGVYISQISTLGVVPWVVHYSLRQGLSFVWNLPSSLAGQRSPGIHLSLSTQCWDDKHVPPYLVFPHVFWGSNSNLTWQGSYMLHYLPP